jgi:hypothetical protein
MLQLMSTRVCDEGVRFKTSCMNVFPCVFFISSLLADNSVAIGDTRRTLFTVNTKTDGVSDCTYNHLFAVNTETDGVSDYSYNHLFAVNIETDGVSD